MLQPALPREPAAGVADCWADYDLLQALGGAGAGAGGEEGVLAPPPSASAALVQWGRRAEVLHALRLLRQLLQHPPPDRPEAYARLARLTVQAAYAAVAVSEVVACAAVEALGGVHAAGALLLLLLL